MFFSGNCTGKEGNAIKDAPPRHIGMLQSNMPMDTALQVFAGDIGMLRSNMPMDTALQVFV